MSGVHYRRFVVIIVLLAGIVLSAFSALANEESPVGQDKFKLALGAFLPAVDTKLQVNNEEFGAGTIIDLEDDLGFDEDVTLGRLSGYWRFAPKHRLFFGYYRFDRNAVHTIDKEIIIDDTIYIVGAELSSDIDVDFYFASYGYSFFQGEKWEVTGTIGVYTLDMSASIIGLGEVRGEEDGIYEEIIESSGLTVPVPLFGLSAEYYITPKWLASASVGYFTLSIDEWSGSLLDINAKLEYLFHKNWGIGVGYSFFDADVERNQDTKTTKADYEYQGVQIFGIWHF